MDLVWQLGSCRCQGIQLGAGLPVDWLGLGSFLVRRDPQVTKNLQLLLVSTLYYPVFWSIVYHVCACTVHSKVSYHKILYFSYRPMETQLHTLAQTNNYKADLFKSKRTIFSTIKKKVRSFLSFATGVLCPAPRFCFCMRGFLSARHWAQIGYLSWRSRPSESPSVFSSLPQWKHWGSRALVL